jgi:Zn-finger nucleic acid-binding protein
MKCPACPDNTLVMTDRQGVEIDYCPACRGIWLDRGELDKLLDRAAAAALPTAVARPAAARVPHRGQQPDFEDSDYQEGRRPYQRSHKKSWLSEIFD